MSNDGNNLFTLITPDLEDIYISAVEQLVDVVTAEDPRLKELKQNSYTAFKLGIEPNLRQSYLNMLEHKITLIKKFTQQLATVKGLVAAKHGENKQHEHGVQENGHSENLPTSSIGTGSDNTSTTNGQEV